MVAGFSFRALRRPGFEVAVLGAEGDSSGFPKHTHDEFVVSANLAGAEAVWLDGRAFEAGPGEITAYNPGAVQASRALPVRGGGSSDAWRFVSLYAEPGFAADALGLATPPTLSAPLLRSPAALAALRRLAAMVAASRAADLPPGLVEEQAVAALAAVAVPAADATASESRPARGGDDPAVRRAAAMLLDRLADPPTLAELAREAGLSREGLVRRFGAACGLPPMAWALQRRLARARALLRAGVAPAEAAAVLGFADQAHLTRLFRRAAGTTPGRYRAAGGGAV